MVALRNTFNFHQFVQNFIRWVCKRKEGQNKPRTPQYHIISSVSVIVNRWRLHVCIIFAQTATSNNKIPMHRYISQLPWDTCTKVCICPMTAHMLCMTTWPGDTNIWVETGVLAYSGYRTSSNNTRPTVAVSARDSFYADYFNNLSLTWHQHLTLQVLTGRQLNMGW